ncbi:MAG: hypothetical protein ABW167_10955 [Baekduia sp.]
MSAKPAILIGLVLLTLLLTASPASAAFSVAGFTTSSTSSVAGAHPDLTTDLTFSTTETTPPRAFADGNVRDLTVDLPAGLIGDPGAVPQCDQSDFSQSTCPAAAQIGTVTVKLLTPSGFPTEPTLPVYNMQPRNDEETAEIAFSFSGLITVHMPLSVRTDGDYGLTAHVTGISRAFGVAHVVLNLWGVPADPAHDAQRIDMQLNPVGPTQLARTPFLTNPTRCGEPLTFRVRANSYQSPGTLSGASASLPPLTGCDAVPFAPRFSLQPTTTQAGAPSGYESVLTLPQNGNPGGQATANLQDAVVTLPAGVAISPSGAAGLGSCDDVSLGLHGTAPATCPGSSKIGEVEIDVPVLPKPLRGKIYLRQPRPGDLFRMALAVDGFGVHAKIPADIEANALTGQLTVTFAQTPQVPFTKLTLRFDGGPHAPLSNPVACGTYTTRAQLTPRSSPAPVGIDSSFAIDQACGQEGAFAPGFSAGSQDPRAGARTSFHLRVTRDGGSALSTIDTTLPPGLLGDIRAVPRCPDAQAAAGTCGPASLIGHATVGAGAGSAPVFLPQAGKAPTAVHLAGPYKGAPFSLSIVVPAQAGPFDLGTVVVRAGLHVDPVTAQATVKADPLPTILEGVPLDVRDVRIDVDRPGFMFNPTSCDPQTVSGTITSASGQAAAVSSAFQSVDCDMLGLRLRSSLTLSGKGQTTDGKHPALSASFTLPRGQSNLKRESVRLPLSLALDPKNSESDDLCEFAAGQKTIPDCPARSIVGSMTARTPILDQPLTGPVYFIKNVRTDPKSGRQIKTLPTLATVLQGQGVTIVLRASSAVVDGHLVTTFDNIPDAPVLDGKLNINGGPKGILVVSGADICKASQVSDWITDGHNGKTMATEVIMGTPCPLAVVAASNSLRSLKVTVSGISAGKLSVSGKGLTKRSRTIASATTATLTLPISRTVRSALAQGRDVRATVSVAFTPKGAKKAKRTSKRIVLRSAKR